MHKGRLVAGRYELQEKVGRGREGWVWRALDTRSGGTVALKGGRVSARVRRILRTLRHPGIVRVLDSGIDDGDHWLVMEYLDGRTLDRLLEETPGGRLPVTEVAWIGARIASALAAVHAERVVHRDVKPGNVMLAGGGEVKLTDFGISRVDWGDPTVTGSGLVAGTPAYMPPEVADGHEPTPASDVFSLGATLFAAVEGVGVYGADTNPARVLSLARYCRTVPPRHAGALEPLLAEMLDADPARRPTAERARDVLEEIAGPSGAPAWASGPHGAAPVLRAPDARRSAVGSALRGTVARVVSGRRGRLAVAGTGMVAAAVLAAVLVPGSGGSATRRPAATRPATLAVIPVMGDPKSADPCALMSTSAFGRYGRATLATAYGGFNRCDVIVRDGAADAVDAELQLDLPGPSGIPARARVERSGTITIIRQPGAGDHCDRALVLPDRNRVLISAKPAGDAAPGLCAVADTATATAVGVLTRSGVPRRTAPFGRGSLAGRDACALLSASALAGVSGIVPGHRDAGFGGWDCRWDSPLPHRYIDLRFDQNKPLDSSYGRRVRLDGRTAYVQAGDEGPHTCTARVEYRSFLDADGAPTVELIELTVGGAERATRLCAMTTRLAAAAVRAA